MRFGTLASPMLLLCTLLSQSTACFEDEASASDDSRAACTVGGARIGATDSHTCHGFHATIVGTEHADHLVGSSGRDVIVGLGGADVIEGLGGDDIICAGNGDDMVHAGAGDDYVDGGDGNDTIYGEEGNDTIHGRDMGDWLHGGPGNDRIFGDLLDDHLFGDDGDDLIVGGHGADEMVGGPGNDWIRGDTNADTITGGLGDDTASFATARPPGQGSDAMDGPGTFPGEIVNLNSGTLVAHGDGEPEELQGIEHIIGSPFRDRLSGDGQTTLEGGYGDDDYVTTGSDHVVATVGNPTCNGAPCGGTHGPGHDASQLFVFVDDHARDTGVVALGTTSPDHFRITMACDGVHVTTLNGAAIHAGPGCDFVTAGIATEVVCTISHPLNYVLAWGDNGDDEITIGNGFPDDMTSIVDGGEDSDIITGGDGQDILFGGMTGSDQLIGNDGDDALLSLSYPSQHNVMGSAFTGGADSLNGGDGNDQLVTDYICAGHFYRGGPGNDIAGFARTGDHPIHAQLGGPSSNPMPYHAHAFNTDLCPDFMRFGTWIDGDLEILEGSLGDDTLVGDDTHNVIWGRHGNDTILGQGGDDELEGDDGNDEIFGGPGRDQFSGGSGFDRLHANDGEADGEISCGSGGGQADTDSHDPNPVACN